MVGVVSLLKNGIYHDTSFSVTMAMTRNPDVDVNARGVCLGETKDMAKDKLMFGVLVQNWSPEIKEVLILMVGMKGSSGKLPSDLRALS